MSITLIIAGLVAGFLLRILVELLTAIYLARVAKRTAKPLPGGGYKIRDWKRLRAAGWNVPEGGMLPPRPKAPPAPPRPPK